MITASIALQVMPKTNDDKNMITIVDAVIDMIRVSGVTYEVGPMETTMEGELDTLIDIVKKAQYLSVQEGADGVFSNLKILYNPHMQQP